MQEPRAIESGLEAVRAAIPAQRASAEAEPRGGYFENFRVLLDHPAASVALGFSDFACGLAELVESSPAEFAVGIFGTWGSGKTTLMESVRNRLCDNENVVTVWFTAWRYEKEQNLLVPLLDVLRDALREKARTEKRAKRWAGRASRVVGSAALAFAQGLTLRADVPGGGVDAEIGKMIEAYRVRNNEAGSLSGYHRGFKLLQDAIAGLSAHGVRRVVIFVDDLDRCMPESALDVLESMKLFLGVEGCVFVVGLDQDIVERAVARKYRRRSDDEDDGVSGAEYVKKMFQVHFTLPGMRAHQVEEFLRNIEDGSGWDANQLEDFREFVRPHIIMALSEEEVVNPRELKRLINLYTVQAKILSRRLDELFRPAVLLTVLLMGYRTSWRSVYDHLVVSTDYVQSVLSKTLEEEDWPSEISLAGRTVSFPPDLAEYLRGPAAEFLIDRHLSAYILAAESGVATDPWVLEARTVASRLRQAGDQISLGKGRGGDSREGLIVFADELHRLIHSRNDSFGRLSLFRDELRLAVDMLVNALHAFYDDADSERAFSVVWDDVIPLLDKVDASLLRWHEYVSLSR